MVDFLSQSLSSIARHDRHLLDAARQKLALGEIQKPAASGASRGALPESMHGPSSGMQLEPLLSQESLDQDAMRMRFKTEAMVEREIRPPLLVRNGTFVLPDRSITLTEVYETIQQIDRTKIDPAIALTGRVEFANVPGRLYGGTGWIAKKLKDNQAIVVTNRHVAETFATPDGRGTYPFRLLPNFSEYQVQFDLLAEFENNDARKCVTPKVLFIAGSRAPDMALLLVEGDHLRGLEPIDFADTDVMSGQDIGVIGYPANDSSSYSTDLQDDLTRYFNDIYNFKRFSFGKVDGLVTDRPEFVHDATTMPGNSGSIVIDRGTGKVVGLHFAGQILSANYAVKASEVQAALAGLQSKSVVVSNFRTEANNHAGITPASDFKGRDGYNPRFLSRSQEIKPPSPGQTWAEDLVAAEDADNGGLTKELKYRHFSVWMSTSRKLPLVTAVNIDGAKAKRVGRMDKWYLDGRISEEVQIDNFGYKANPLDRGHMVRREDPVWGNLNTARQANRDTFHYTNAAPQHEALNQKDWLRLEEYVLGSAKTHDLKVSVFTGPVFKDDDQSYRHLVKIPKAFWKIVAIINAETDKPSVTGYLLSQGDLIRDITGEFVYGQFRTYQTEVAEIGNLARLDVNHLVEFDPFTTMRHEEGLENNNGRFRVINTDTDLIL